MSDAPHLNGTDTDSVVGESATNPYAPPSVAETAEAAVSEAEAIRNKYLNHESSVKSIGAIYLLGALVTVPVGFGMLFKVIWGGVNVPLIAVVVSVFYSLIGLLQAFTALGLRRFQQWARVTAIVLSLVGLLAIPIGTIVSGLFLYILLCDKSRVVFSEDYQRVIEQTPYIKYNASMVIWILLFCVFGLISVGMVGMLLGAS